MRRKFKAPWVGSILFKVCAYLVNRCFRHWVTLKIVHLWLHINATNPLITDRLASIYFSKGSLTSVSNTVVNSSQCFRMLKQIFCPLSAKNDTWLRPAKKALNNGRLCDLSFPKALTIRWMAMWHRCFLIPLTVQ